MDRFLPRLILPFTFLIQFLYFSKQRGPSNSGSIKKLRLPYLLDRIFFPFSSPCPTSLALIVPTFAAGILLGCTFVLILLITFFWNLDAERQLQAFTELCCLSFILYAVALLFDGILIASNKMRLKWAKRLLILLLSVCALYLAKMGIGLIILM